MIKENEALLRYLMEFRKRLIRCLVVLLVVFIGLLYFSNNFFTYLAKPLLRYLPIGQGLIATDILSPIVVPFELSFILALFLTIPIILHQVWSYVTPALYPNERRLLWPLLWMSILLFYTGVVFAYFVIFPFLFGFIASTAPVGVQVSPDIAQYLSFSIKLLFVFGIIFEVPIITIILICSGLTTRTQLIQWRSYVIVSAFVIGMLLTPPDVVSQIVVAIPLWFLFEVGIVLAPLFMRHKRRVSVR